MCKYTWFGSESNGSCVNTLGLVLRAMDHV